MNRRELSLMNPATKSEIYKGVSEKATYGFIRTKILNKQTRKDHKISKKIFTDGIALLYID